MRTIFSILVVLSMFSFTACGDENSPAFYVGDTNRTQVSKVVLPIEESELSKKEGFLREKDSKEEPKDLQNSLRSAVFTYDNMLPVVEVNVSEMLNGEIQITEVLN